MHLVQVQIPSVSSSEEGTGLPLQVSACRDGSEAPEERVAADQPPSAVAICIITLTIAVVAFIFLLFQPFSQM